MDVSNIPVVIPPPQGEHRTHVDRVYGRETLPVWAQVKLRALEASQDLTGCSAFMEDDDTLVIVTPESPYDDVISVVIGREAAPFGGMDDSILIRWSPPRRGV